MAERRMGILQGPATVPGILFSAAVILLAAMAAAAGCTAAAAPATIHELLREHGLPAGCCRRWCALLRAVARQPRLLRPPGGGEPELRRAEGRGGLSQEELFLWLPVRGVVVSDPSSGVLLLDIGVAHKQLSLSLFEDPPDCHPAGEAEWPPDSTEEGTEGGEGLGRPEVEDDGFGEAALNKRISSSGAAADPHCLLSQELEQKKLQDADDIQNSNR
ncbi:unnamed protein product [Spirodela intermedia]|uniref:Uncharacterized protein n=1 Tax=Spirodela intermedia TaxID=51605 RepID=A0A7I8ILE9_SPIIN|nr:unnamed protein product [Spirodela intermedia]CAA6658347.1 unnamed protein product [Spirodela intermedia]